LRARATNTSDYHLIPGPLSVFSDNFHIAKTELGTTPPGADFDVFLGVDPDIKVFLLFFWVVCFFGCNVWKWHLNSKLFGMFRLNFDQ
jgi:hypothetical protein